MKNQNKVIIDREKADLVFGRLVDAIKNRKFPFDHVRVPQVKENIPQSIVWGSYEHALFLFVVCYYMRGGIKSETAILSMARLYESNPEIFNPYNSLKEEDVKECLGEFGLNYSSSHVSRFWVYNWEKLKEYWSCDPRKIFEVDDYEQLCSRLMRGKSKDPANGFFGFREKMVSMLLYFYMHAGIVPETKFPLPIDFHLQRTMVVHRILKVKGLGIGDDHYSQALLAAGRKITHEYCLDNDVSSLDLADALWLLSSTQCNQHLGNRSVGGRNRDGRQTELRPYDFAWTEKNHRRYENSCGKCPINNTCELAVPAASYYIKGQLLVRGVKQVPKQLTWNFDET